jgi:hypothetical protein
MLFRRFPRAGIASRRRAPARPRFRPCVEWLEARLAPARVQFSAASETVNESAGSFSIPVTLTGTVTPTVSTFASGFSDPFGLAFDAAGNLFVSNDTGTVDKVTPGGPRCWSSHSRMSGMRRPPRCRSVLPRRS